MISVSKIVKLVLIVIISLTLVLFTASLLLSSKVGEIVIGTLNKNVATKLEAGSFRLSLLRKFPKASLQLKNVLVHSSGNFDKASFKGEDTDTLLFARNVSVDFRLSDIIRGTYNIERIGARNGKISLLADSNGKVNYEISKGGDSGSDPLIINLERINFSEMEAGYYDLENDLKISGIIRNGRIKSRIAGDNVDFSASGDITLTGFRLSETTLARPVDAGIDLVLSSSAKTLLFRKSELKIGKNSISMEGSVSAGNLYDLKLDSRDIDLSVIRYFIPPKYDAIIANYEPEGNISVSGTIKGLLSHASNPHIEVKCDLKKGHVGYKRSKFEAGNLSFTASFTNGKKNNAQTSVLSVQDIKARIGSSDYSGWLALSELDHPKTELALKGRVVPAELKEFLGLDKLSTAEGTADIDIQLSTYLHAGSNLKTEDFLYLKPEGRITLNSVSLGVKNDSVLVSNIRGDLELSGAIKARSLEFTYREQRFIIDGEFMNLPELIAGKPVNMVATARLSADRLNPGEFIDDTPAKGAAETGEGSISFPSGIFLDLDFNIGKLDYKSFSSKEIKGSLTYKPKLLTFKSFNMKAMGGDISGAGFIVQKPDNAYVTSGNFDVSGIDVKNAFISFRNFGQDFIKAENISGTLSGTISLLMPADRKFKANIPALTAEGKYRLTNGALTNFDPVKQLSAFIELSELENIHFDNLENDFFIRNNNVYIPQMDVRSSAVDLTVNGMHSFDNNYEYHVKMLLSELLSNKRNKSGDRMTEFGVVKDDGLGRTSLLLKIESQGNDVKVGYDMKAAGDQIRAGIKSEKQNLKTILNEEYGWYRNEAVAKDKPAEKNTRFSISYGDKDSTGKDAVKKPVKSKSGTKKVFVIEQ